MTVSRLIARPMLASMFVVGGLNAVRGADKLAPRAEPVLDRLVPLLKKAAPGLPIPENPETLVRINGGVQRVHFFKNVSMLGGLLIAAGDTDGRPGIAWRARRAARDARREAKHLAGAARREAKLAKAQLT
jgi:putative oxidoreductase